MEILYKESVNCFVNLVRSRKWRIELQECPEDVEKHRVTLHDGVGPHQHKSGDQLRRGDDPADEKLAKPFHSEHLNFFVAVVHQLSYDWNNRLKASGVDAGLCEGPDLRRIRLKRNLKSNWASIVRNT